MGVEINKQKTQILCKIWQFSWQQHIQRIKQEGHDGPRLLNWAKIGHESDGLSGIRAAD